MAVYPFSDLSAKVLVALLVCVLSTAHSAKQEVTPAVVSYAAPTDVSLHEPIVVRVTVQNNTPAILRLRLGLGASRNFVIRIVLPNGRVVDTPRYPPITDGPKNTGRRSISAFGSYTHELILNRWFEFDEPGLYRVIIDLASKVESETGETIHAAARGELTVRVGLRDEGALHGICHELLSRIRATTDVRIQFAAAAELAHVVDEVALPYITQVLDYTSTVDHFLFPALVRLSTPEAQRVLEEMARSRDDGRASQAAQALHELTKKGG